MAQHYLGRETASQRELSVIIIIIIRNALSSLNDAVEEGEETLEEIASKPIPNDDLFDASETPPLPDDDLFNASETPLPGEEIEDGETLEVGGDRLETNTER